MEEALWVLLGELKDAREGLERRSEHLLGRYSVPGARIKSFLCLHPHQSPQELSECLPPLSAGAGELLAVTS